MHNYMHITTTKNDKEQHYKCYSVWVIIKQSCHTSQNFKEGLYRKLTRLSFLFNTMIRSPTDTSLYIHYSHQCSCFLISNMSHFIKFPHPLLHLAPPPLLAVPLPHLLPLLQHLPHLLHPPPPHHSPPSWPFLHPHFLSINRKARTLTQPEGKILSDSSASQQTISTPMPSLVQEN
jgi:hypothetical protein